MEVLQIHRQIKREAARRKVCEILEKMHFSDIPSLMETYPFQLSGGMAQRVLIAAAMLNDPAIIIADEPTRALDKALRSSVAAELLAGDQTNRPAVLLITHDLDLAARFSDRTVVMYAGEAIEICDTKKFFEKPLHPYSQALLGSLPGKGFRALEGMMPTPLNLPRGCRFHPRCRFKTDACTRRKPGFISIENRQVRCTKYA
jgi:oligopeptide/dipeptide ABC transporter ATP-binding protein